MKQVAQMLGVELEEEFKVENRNFIYKINPNGLFYLNSDGEWKIYSYMLMLILAGKNKIIKKPILDEVEREYLSNVIKPFRDRVEGILKYTTGSYAYIEITYRDYAENIGCIYLPSFKKDTMYKGMETGKKYSLEDLGL